MAVALLPDARFRPQTAMPDDTDVRDDVVYSALVVANGASGNGGGSNKMFATPQGQPIPEMTTATATNQQHQMKYTDLTTNLQTASIFGSGLGDAAVRGISLTLEAAGIANDGTYNAYGACPIDVIEFLAKASFKFTVGNKVMTQGPCFTFPSWGGPQASIATVATGMMNGVASNGNSLLGGRRIRIPIKISRQDVVTGEVNFAAAFVGTNSATYGQPFLVWSILNVLLGADVR